MRHLKKRWWGWAKTALRALTESVLSTESKKKRHKARTQTENERGEMRTSRKEVTPQ